MLAVGLNNEAFSNFAVPAPVVLYPNPNSRTWVLTVVYRADGGNPGGCRPILGWTGPLGGFGYQPGKLVPGQWRSFSQELPGSAGGTNGEWSVYVTAGCDDAEGVLYVDGVTIN